MFAESNTINDNIVAAIENGNIELIANYIKENSNHANVKLKNSAGLTTTILNHSIEFRQKEITEILVNKGASLSHTAKEDIPNLIPQKTSFLQKIKAANPLRQYDKRTPLMVAAQKEGLDTMKQLLSKGASVAIDGKFIGNHIGLSSEVTELLTNYPEILMQEAIENGNIDKIKNLRDTLGSSASTSDIKQGSIKVSQLRNSSIESTQKLDSHINEQQMSQVEKTGNEIPAADLTVVSEVKVTVNDNSESKDNEANREKVISTKQQASELLNGIDVKNVESVKPVEQKPISGLPEQTKVNVR
jgi:ankyrin repeat protein